MQRFARAGYADAATDAREADEQAYKSALAGYDVEHDAWATQRDLARQVLAGDVVAYQSVLTAFPILSESENLCAGVEVSVRDRHVAELNLTVRGRDVIPSETKSLTSTGKVSIKSTPKARFHDLFQDYVASCMIRAGRDVFGVLPLEHLLVTAAVPTNGAESPANRTTVPVLSVVFARSAFLTLPFQTLDPSDTIEALPHRGDAKASKRTGEFIQIVPLTHSDLGQRSDDTPGLEYAVTNARALREQLDEQLTGLVAQLEDAPTPE